MEEEIWKDIPGLEGKYQASNFGNIKSVNHTVVTSKGITHHRKEHQLHPSLARDGYLRLNIVLKDGRVKKYFIHRLVAMAFLPNPNNYPMVNHKDENKTNNHITNLEWCEAKYNINYGTGIKRRAVQVQKRVEMLDKNTNEVLRIFESVGEASAFVGVSIACITNTCTNYDGHHKTCRGYKWRYAAVTNGIVNSDTKRK